MITLKYLLGTGISMLNQAWLSGLNFLVGLAFIRYAPKADYGIYLQLFAALMLAVTVHRALFIGPLQVLAPKKDKQGGDRLVAHLGVLQMLLTLLASVGALLALQLFPLPDAGITSPVTLGLMFGVWILASLQREFLRGLAYLRHRPERAAVIDLIFGGVLLTGLFVLLSAEAIRLDTVIPLMAASSLCAMLWRGGRHLRWQEHLSATARIRQSIRETWRLARWTLPGVTVTWVYSNTYLYISAAMLGPEETADLGASRLLLMPIGIMLLGWKNVYLPRASRWLGEGSFREARTVAMLSLMAMIAMAATYIGLLYFAFPYLREHLLGESYAHLLPYVALWAVYFGIRCFTLTGNSLVSAGGQFKALFYYSFTSMIVGLIAMGYGTWQYGAMGAIAGLVLAELVSALLIWTRGIKRTREQCPEAEQHQESVGGDATSSATAGRSDHPRHIRREAPEQTAISLPTSSEADALDEIRNAGSETPVIVDFDETLLLTNSTEAYLSTLRPRWLATLVLYLLDSILPRLGAFKEPRIQDWIRVQICSLLFPWNRVLWRAEAARVAARYTNEPLLAALKQSGADRKLVASHSCTFIIRPILAAMDLADIPLTASRLLGGHYYLRHGKLAAPAVSEVIGDAIFLTDSEADRRELQLARIPLLVKWRNAVYQRALSDEYIPLWYTHKIKHPGKRYLLRGIVQDDFVFWLLAAVWLPAWPWQFAGMCCLLLSFWCVYEVGYRENDRLGELRESDPKLSDAYRKGGFRREGSAPWMWAAGSGAIGCLLLALAQQAAFNELWLLRSLGIWLLVLLAVRTVYAIYNRLAKSRRPLLYWVLQAARYFSFVAVVPVTLGGAAVLAACTFARSYTYALYRRKRVNQWPKDPVATFRGLIGVLTVVPIAVYEGGLAGPHVVSYALILIWCVFRMRSDLKKLLQRNVTN